MAEAKIYDAKLSPTKDEIAAQFSKIVKQHGSYRAVDPNNEVGIEVIVGEDASGLICQLALSYRPADQALDDELIKMHHSELGERSVAYLTSDPVAVRAIITMILTGEHGADFSLGEPIFDVYGTGTTSDAVVTDIDIQENNVITSIGEATINGEERKYQLRIERWIHNSQSAEEDELVLAKDGDVPVIRLALWS